MYILNKYLALVDITAEYPSYTINGMLYRNIVLKCYQGLKTGERGCKNVIFEVYKQPVRPKLGP